VTDRRRFPIGLTIATLIGLAILIALGVWQLQRLTWKESLLARIAAFETAPAQPLADVLARGRAEEFMRVTAVCPGLSSAAFVEVFSVRDGGAGSRLISPCRIEGTDGRQILVDRGFVADIISARPPVLQSADPVAVTGLLRTGDKGNAFTPPSSRGHFYSRDLVGIAAALGVPLPESFFLMAESSTNPEWEALVPSPLPAEITNRHLEYALTWFGLAAALVGVYAALLWRRGSKGGR